MTELLSATMRGLGMLVPMMVMGACVIVPFMWALSIEKTHPRLSRTIVALYGTVMFLFIACILGGGLSGT